MMKLTYPQLWFVHFLFSLMCISFKGGLLVCFSKYSSLAASHELAVHVVPILLQTWIQLALKILYS